MTFRSIGTCYQCHRERELETRYDHAAKFLCDECAAQPPRKPRAEGLDDGAPAAKPRGPLEVIEAVGRTPASPRWLWAKWIPLKALTVLAGEPEKGKSTLVCRVVAELSRGHLPGNLEGEPRRSVLVSLEDTIDEILIPRLTAADADLGMVSFIRCRPEVDGGLDLSKHLSAVEDIAKAKDAALISIDPLVATLGGNVDSHKDQSVRSVLAPAAAMAERLDVAVLGVMHFKKDAVHALLSVNASIGFVGAARSLLVLGPKPDDEEGHRSPHRVLAHAKSNWGPKEPSLAAHIEQVMLDGGIETSRVVLGEPVDVGPDDLLPERAPRGRPPKERDQVKRAVLSLLSVTGPLMQARIAVALGRQKSDGTVRRALDDLVADGALATAGDPVIYALPEARGANSGNPAQGAQSPVREPGSPDAADELPELGASGTASTNGDPVAHAWEWREDEHGDAELDFVDVDEDGEP